MQVQEEEKGVTHSLVYALTDRRPAATFGAKETWEVITVMNTRGSLVVQSLFSVYAIPHFMHHRSTTHRQRHTMQYHAHPASRSWWRSWENLVSLGPRNVSTTFICHALARLAA